MGQTLRALRSQQLFTVGKNWKSRKKKVRSKQKPGNLEKKEGPLEKNHENPEQK